MEIRVSIRQLVEFILRGGDIDNRRSGGLDTAMQEGGRIHRMIQRRMGSEYHAEVSLKYIWQAPGYDVIIEGRADGIIDAHWGRHPKPDGEEHGSLPAVPSAQRPVVDEIKGTYRELKRITHPVAVHLAQAKCYAFIYARENGLDSIGVRMTYCHMETEEIRYFHEDYTFGELSCWFEELLSSYQKWTDFQFEWSRRRTDAIRGMDFPFPYRDGQRELVAYVYQTIYHRRKLFIEAPTGVGKTISTVFPAVKAMGEGKVEKIFYLTAKTIARTVAQECFSLLQEKGLCLKVLVLTAKDKVCFLREEGADVQCDPVSCPYAAGHFDRVNDAMYELLAHEDHFTREVLLAHAKAHRVCPFEFSLDMSLFSDAVICDYNYVFDPRASLKRFFADGLGKRDYVFLIDEAHNLLDRGREMYSARLFKGAFQRIRRLLAEIAPRAAKCLDQCDRELLAMKRECEDYQVEESIDGFVRALTQTYGALDDLLDEHDTFPDKKEVLEFYFEAAHFLNIYEVMDDRYVAYSQLMDDGDLMLRLFCMDPSADLRQRMQKGRSAILFSATLLPIQYYKKVLGGEPEDYEVYAKSTFDERKRALLIANDVTSKYTRRSRDEYEKIAHYIYEVVRQRRGNYMVFLPSHLFLEQVYDCFMESWYDGSIMECIAQEDHMSEAEREDFLLRFRGNEECVLSDHIDFEIEEVEDMILIGFCVMGGIFSEGIDLKHDSLIGAVIVGTGIPQVGCERELLKAYFDRRGENGFDHAYRYPGMNKVLQSAGRVIRTAEDVGVIVLLDERFLETRYRQMFPREWSRYQVSDVSGIAGKVRDFWAQRD